MAHVGKKRGLGTAGLFCLVPRPLELCDVALPLPTQEQLTLTNADEPVQGIANEIYSGQMHYQPLHDGCIPAVTPGEPDRQSGVKNGQEYGRAGREPCESVDDARNEYRRREYCPIARVRGLIDLIQAADH